MQQQYRTLVTSILRLGLLLGLLAGGGTAHAQVSPGLYDYARPGLDWYVVETEHFNVLFHADSAGAGSSRTAQVTARIAEEVYAPITSLYGHEPDTKVAIILKDYEDYSNGAAYFFDNKIEIWSPALDSPLRGDHNWLRNVITHEFTHIVQVQTAMKSNRRLPFFYLQWLGYEDVKRPDVLYGYPNAIITYPIPTLNNPAWLAEGTAQYQRAGLDYDRWDTHRDMLLRTRVLAGKGLSLADMGGFYSHSSLIRESVYNHGYAFTRYLAGRYGEDALRRVSAALGEWRNVNVERALDDALGVPGAQVHAAWMADLHAAYAAQTEAVRAHLVAGDLVEPDGFYNLYPRFSPDGGRVAYVSNRREDFSLSSLYIRDLETGALLSFEIEGGGAEGPGHTCALGHKIKSGVGGAITWRPDGGAIVYARGRETARGHLYDNLYELDLDTRKPRRLTNDERASMPAYAPDGTRIAFVRQADGTTNLALLDPETKAVTAVTTFRDGTQVSDPAWHPSGDWIYFARTAAHGRDLWRVRPDGTDLAPVHATDADERQPAFGRDGGMLYFASDATGIFNLYRLPVPAAGAPTAAPEQLTNVLGGAFMPAVDPSGAGALLFARYDWDGYKIARLDAPGVPAAAANVRYLPPALLQKGDVPALVSSDGSDLSVFDDTDVRRLAPGDLAAVHTEGYFPLQNTSPGTAAEAAPRRVERYRGGLFTAFSFFPVLRFDRYAARQAGLEGRVPKARGTEGFWRTTKAGAYVSSREVLEGLSMLGGLLVGPGSGGAKTLGGFFSPSNLLDMERDAFLQFEYRRGLGLIPRRWSPQLSLEMYNIRRNVDNGLSIEEIPCTACLPDTTFTDLSYSLWEANIAARSKVTRNLLVEVGYRYSPYRVTTKGFFSRESQRFLPRSSSRYYIGRAYRLKAYFEADAPHRHSDVVPRALRVEAGYEYEPGRLLERFDIEDGVLAPKYEAARNHRLTLDARFGLAVGRGRAAPHGIGLRLHGSTLLGGAVDDFYNDYVGGLIGARGYPFYALGGNETLWLQASYGFPIVPQINRQLLFLYADKLYGRVYADAAAAWSGPWPGLSAVRKDVGAELRLGLGSFYLLPTAVFLSATYGLDAFDVRLNEGFVAPDGRDRVRYGQALLWHFGVLFAFDP